MSFEIAREYGIPQTRQFGNVSNYKLQDVYRYKADALRASRTRRRDGTWFARVVQVTKPHDMYSGLPYKTSDYRQYALYVRPKKGWYQGGFGGVVKW